MKTGFEILGEEASVVWMNTRIPFRYGIATLTELPHLFLRLSLRVDGAGEPQKGVSAEGLLPKWFDKNPHTSAAEDLENMWGSISHALSRALEIRRFDSVFDLWKQLYEAQKVWGEERGFPALLWHFGVTMVERAVIDAFCRHHRTPVSRVLREGGLGIDAAAVDPGISAESLAAVTRLEPLSHIAVRHTVGMSDPLTKAEVKTPIGDGLPETLEEDIAAYDLRYFKIKVRGDIDADIDRLTRIAEIFDRAGVRDFRFSLDGNEQFHDVDTFREFFQSIHRSSALETFFRNLLFVEQPFARAEALSGELGAALSGWSDRPPIIIDESDGSIDDAARALELGYAGTSYKNCKGVIKGVLNAARIHQARSAGRSNLLMSGEDLVNVGPVALLQDLAMMAKLGISHVERNGHHYFRGLSRFSEPLQEEMLRSHGDLYHQHGDGFAALKVSRGRLALRSVNEAPFGAKTMPEEAPYRPLLETPCPKPT